MPVQSKLIPSLEDSLAMQNAVIVGGGPYRRRPEERQALGGTVPDDLLADTLKALVERVKIDPSEVEDVVMGCVDQVGEQGLNIARNAALIAGFPGRRLRDHARPHVRLRPAGDELRGHGRDVGPVRVRDRGRLSPRTPSRRRKARPGALARPTSAKKSSSASMIVARG